VNVKTPKPQPTPTPPPPPSPDKLLQALQEGFAVLGLGEMRRVLEETLAEPVPDESRLSWLWRLVEPQVRRRVENRVERRVREARLPERKTLASFNFAFQPKLDRDLVLELATLRFLDQGKNLLLAGMSGTGKSHLAKALGLEACTANRWVIYTTSADLLARLNMSLADDTLPQALKPYTRAELLILDEVGMEQVERKTASRSGLMQKVLLPRYNAHRSTIITSNIPWEGWGEYLDDHLGATALLDRLLHRSHVIVINGPSYRDWVHKQEVAGATVEDEVRPPTANRRAKPAPGATSGGDRRRRH
jgi:DNA replication protein DnaC